MKTKIISMLALSISFTSSCKSAVEWNRFDTGVQATGTSPVSAELTFQKNENDKTSLQLSVTKFIETEKDVTVTVRVPKGVELVSSDSISPIKNNEKGVFRREILLRHMVVPSEDLSVEIDSQGTSFGVHANLVYRFGRAEPKIAPMERSTENVKIGNIDLGNPVLLPTENKK